MIGLWGDWLAVGIRKVADGFSLGGHRVPDGLRLRGESGLDQLSLTLTDHGTHVVTWLRTHLIHHVVVAGDGAEGVCRGGHPS